MIDFDGVELVEQENERLLSLLESLLSITEQFTEGEIHFDHPEMETWHKISAETADIRNEKDIRRM